MTNCRLWRDGAKPTTKQELAQAWVFAYDVCADAYNAARDALCPDGAGIDLLQELLAAKEHASMLLAACLQSGLTTDSALRLAQEGA